MKKKLDLTYTDSVLELESFMSDLDVLDCSSDNICSNIRSIISPKTHIDGSTMKLINPICD
jgi:hypothetical protein